LGTWREHVGNKGKMKKKIPPFPNPKLKLLLFVLNFFPLSSSSLPLLLWPFFSSFFFLLFC
jgi:hypothetical protein